MANQMGEIFLKGQQYVGWENEADAGVPETLAAADFNVLMSNMKLTLQIEENPRKYAVGDPFPFDSVMGRRKGTLTGTIHLQGSGQTGVNPVMFKVLACGPFQLGNDSVYRSAILGLPNKTATIEVLERESAATNARGKKYTLKGCGLTKLVAAFDNTGEIMRYDVEVQGALWSIADMAEGSFPTPVLDDDESLPPAVLGIDIDYRTVAIPTQMLAVDFGLKSEMCQYAQDPTGYSYCVARNFDPVINFNPLMQLEATQGYVADLMGTPAPGPFEATIGSGVAKEISILAPNAQVVKGLDLDDRDEIDSTNIMLRCIRTGVSANPCIGIFQNVA